MKYSISKTQAKSAYLQLYTQLREDIVAGFFPWGTRLPSKRLLAEETGLSVITVEHAYGILCDEGYAEARERSGYYVIYREDDFHISSEHMTAVASGESRSLSHSSAAVYKSLKEKQETPFPFSVLSRTMRKVLTDYGEELLVKSPNQGCLDLRRALSAYLARSSGIHALPEQIVIGSGAEYLYTLILQLLGKDRIYALEQPSYEKIFQVYGANKATCEFLALGPDGIDSKELQRTAATVLHVTPFHSFPSGVTASASKRREYLKWAELRQGYIIEDNYDSELTVSRKHEDALFSLADQGRVLYLNTFSKTIAPSIRVGYLVLPEELLSVFEEKLGFYSCTVPVFEQYVLAQLLESGDFERHINRVRRERRKNML